MLETIIRKYQANFCLPSVTSKGNSYFLVSTLGSMAILSGENKGLCSFVKTSFYYNYLLILFMINNTDQHS